MGDMYLTDFYANIFRNGLRTTHNKKHHNLPRQNTFHVSPQTNRSDNKVAVYLCYLHAALPINNEPTKEQANMSRSNRLVS